jgi:hypothetical protein
MREIRPSGSEGGETGQPVFPTPIDEDQNLMRMRPTVVRRCKSDFRDSDFRNSGLDNLRLPS